MAEHYTGMYRENHVLETKIIRSFLSMGFLFIVVLNLVACRTTPEPPVFSIAQLATVQRDIVYCTPDNKPQYMDVYFPDSGGPWPAVLYVHGGGWQLGDKVEGEYLRFLGDNGILLASINYRLTEDGKFPIMIEDVKCAVRYLRAYSAEYNIDPDRIGAAGSSAGGHLVALLGLTGKEARWDDGEFTEQSSQVQAVVALSGIHDFTVEMPADINNVIYEAFEIFAGSSDPENVAASPVSYITPDAPPFLIIHGDDDELVPVEQSVILHAQLTGAGVLSTLIIVEGGNHYLRGPDPSLTIEEIWAAMGEFFEKTLLFYANP